MLPTASSPNASLCRCNDGCGLASRSGRRLTPGWMRCGNWRRMALSCAGPVAPTASESACRRLLRHHTPPRRDGQQTGAPASASADPAPMQRSGAKLRSSAQSLRRTPLGIRSGGLLPADDGTVPGSDRLRASRFGSASARAFVPARRDDARMVASFTPTSPCAPVTYALRFASTCSLRRSSRSP